VFKQIADANQVIGKAEDLLWPGKKPRAQVAILAPRSSEFWDQKGIPNPTGISDATNNKLNAFTVDYMAEVATSTWPSSTRTSLRISWMRTT
jgi:hypothetical protein